MKTQETFSTQHQQQKHSVRPTSILWLILGPGLIAMIGDNDAGGVLSYVLTGAEFGIGFFIPLILLLGPLTYTVQEMVMRLCIVTQQGFTNLISLHFGRFWARFSLFTLMTNNILSLITEFIGMSAGLAILGVPFAIADIISLACVISIAIFGNYLTKERLAIILGAFNVIFLVISIMTHPSLTKIANAFTHFTIPNHTGSLLLWYIIATIGNAFAPWMIFFQGSAVLDKGMTTKDIPYGRLDTAIGSTCQVIIAVMIILFGAALYTPSGNLLPFLSGPMEIIHAYTVATGPVVADLFAFGLFNAGFLAAFTISTSTAWTFANTLGWANSLNDKPTKAPKFYAIYIGSLCIAAAIVLVPSLPLSLMAVMAQFVSAILIVPSLIFLLLLTYNKRIMGEYANGSTYNMRGWLIVGGITLLSVALVLHVVHLL
jgi:Mn2+/Fe2+ NRAMP family transporter